MSLEPPPSENPTFLDTLVKSEEYHQRFNCREDVGVLINAAKVVILENAEHLRKASKRGRLDLLLLAMLDYAPCDDGKRYVSIVIQLAQEKGPQEVVSVAEAWQRYLCFKMMAVAKRSRSEPNTSQAPTLDETRREIRSATRSEQGRLREQVSRRERHRCAISGDYDVDYFANPAHRALLPPDPLLSSMQACHIFPLSLNHFDEKTNTRAEITWDMLRAWTGIDFRVLIGSKINTPANCIYMTQNLHNSFRKFRFYFDDEPYQDVPNKYQVRAMTTEMTLFNGKNTEDTEFHTSDENGNPIDPPDPWFLKIHAALARVLHASGAAGHFEAVERDADTYGTLHPSGETDVELLLEARLMVTAH